jgi:hypothetical protein
MQLHRIVVLIVLTISAGIAVADVDPRDADAQMYPAGIQYNPDIPTPASVLGFELGAAPVRHHQLVDYLTTVANLSDRLSVEVIGYTHERRPILFLTITSRKNRGNLDNIRREHAALTEPGSNQQVRDDMPIVTWLNYGVHGVEASGMDAALPFIYYLAAAQGDEIENILDKSVILVTAVFNPDGHNQRIAWLDAYGGKNAIADPAHAEHNFDQQFARTNHYWFDLNRQWLLLTQPESRAWMRKWHEWRPNLTVDYHEMGDEQTYYFHPGVTTRTNPLVPEEAERLMAETARTSETFLDSEARLYFHGERFDNYYIGKGSTFPLVNGGVGILYEAAVSLGRELETGNGLRTNRENIRKHFRTSVSSVQAATRLRLDYLRYQKRFYDSAIEAASKQSTRAWVFSAPGDPARLSKFVDLLNFHRIETFSLTRDLVVGEDNYYASDAVVVPVSQPQNRMIRSIFESVHDFEDATFYDVSTWTLPPAFGLQYAALARRDWRQDLVGEPYNQRRNAVRVPDQSTYAYAFEWNAYYAPGALQRVLQEGLLAKVALKPFEAQTTQGSIQFARGSILVPLDRQTTSREDIFSILKDVATLDGVLVHALTSGRSVTGSSGANVGGPSFKPLKKPEVLLVVGKDINRYDAGEVWHLLDYRMNIPVTLRPRDALASIDWDRYSHIVFPSGNYDEYEPEFADRLRQWVAEGGTVVGLRDAAAWVRSTTLDWIDPDDIEAIAAAADASPEEDEDAVARLAYSDKDDHEAVDIIGGAIFSADLDITHPLGFGYAKRAIYLHKNTHDVMLPTDDPYSSVIVYDSDPVASGYVSKDNAETLAATPALIATRSGAGSVILFADNTNFRGYWYGTNKLFLNSLFFSTAFDAPAED